MGRNVIPDSAMGFEGIPSKYLITIESCPRGTAITLAG